MGLIFFLRKRKAAKSGISVDAKAKTEAKPEPNKTIKAEPESEPKSKYGTY